MRPELFTVSHSPGVPKAEIKISFKNFILGLQVRKLGIGSLDLKFDEDFKSAIGESQLLLVLPIRAAFL